MGLMVEYPGNSVELLFIKISDRRTRAPMNNYPISRINRPFLRRHKIDFKLRGFLLLHGLQMDEFTAVLRDIRCCVWLANNVILFK